MRVGDSTSRRRAACGQHFRTWATSQVGNLARLEAVAGTLARGA
jgi:hypothetical protein